MSMTKTVTIDQIVAAALKQAQDAGLTVVSADNQEISTTDLETKVANTPTKESSVAAVQQTERSISKRRGKILPIVDDLKQNFLDGFAGKTIRMTVEVVDNQGNVEQKLGENELIAYESSTGGIGFATGKDHQIELTAFVETENFGTFELSTYADTYAMFTNFKQFGTQPQFAAYEAQWQIEEPAAIAKAEKRNGGAAKKTNGYF